MTSQLFEAPKFSDDDIAIGGTVIYKTLKGYYKMSKAKEVAGMKVRLENGDTIQTSAVVSTDASDWKKFKDKSLNEMEDGYANGEYRSADPPQVTAMPDANSTPDVSITVSSVPEPEPEPEHVPAAADPKLVNVYAQSINAVSYQGGDQVVKFDVVFSVSCTCPDSGNVSTFQVVKRIGIDRLKIAEEARNNVPVSIVEAVKKPGFHLSTAATKRLAGL